jgi:hypothetical protein
MIFGMTVRSKYLNLFYILNLLLNFLKRNTLPKSSPQTPENLDNKYNCLTPGFKSKSNLTLTNEKKNLSSTHKNQKNQDSNFQDKVNDPDYATCKTINILIIILINFLINNSH